MSVTAPFLPFSRPSIDEETIAGVAEVLRTGWLTGGPKVREFEQALSDYFLGRPVRAFSSGTAALEVALRLLGIGAGDEVITTPLSWVATANVILTVGARPVFVDIDPATRNIDLEQLAPAITRKTRAIMPVDLAGLPVDRDRLYAVAEDNRLRVIEDAAQSMGARWRGRRIGSFGDFVAFSFHANKNMTTGEGGCLVLPDESMLPLCEKLRLQGVVRLPDGSMEVDVIGGKFNLTDIAARIGLGQLARLEEFNQRRRELARRYFACLNKMKDTLGSGLPLPDFENGNWHMFQVVLPLKRMSIDRGGFIDEMRTRGIGIGVHYPAMHLFAIYRRLGYKEGGFPNAERIGRGIVTLPLFPAMSEDDVDRVCEAFCDVVNLHRI